MKRPKTNFDDLEERRTGSISRMTFDLLTLVKNRVIEKLRERGYADVGMAHGVLLRNMDLSGSPLSEVARRAGVSRQAVAKVAAELSRLGYVETEKSSEDARVKIVRLTNRGVVFVTDTIEIYEQIDVEICDLIGSTPFRALQKTLRKLTTKSDANVLFQVR